MWVEIVRAVGWSRCPTTRRSMLGIKIAIIIKRKIHASLSLFSMQISHIKHQPFLKKINKTEKRKNLFFFLKKRITKIICK
jgi:hypothetical protein